MRSEVVSGDEGLEKKGKEDGGDGRDEMEERKDRRKDRIWEKVLIAKFLGMKFGMLF